jgi:hypothetical protein
MASKTVTETYEMYGGEVELVYLPNSHTYKIDGDKKIGVTTITGVINKESLMLWPRDEALTLLRRELITKPQAMDANRLTFTIDKIEELLKQAETAYLVKRTRGTDAGTAGHDWLEQFLLYKQGKRTMPEKLVMVAKTEYEKMNVWDDERIRMEDHNHLVTAINDFISWFKSHQVKVLEVERIVYSREYDYAGRFDAILEIDGKVYMIDFKTSNPSRDFIYGVYPENFAQTGGYHIAYSEEFPKVKIDGHAIFNLSKKTGKLYVEYSDEVDLNKEFFLMAMGTKRGMQHHTRRLSAKYKEFKKK